MGHTSTSEKSNNVNENNDFHIVAIDIGVPRRPPTRKRAKDQELYAGLVEFIFDSSDYSSNILYETSGGKLGYSASDEAEIVSHCSSISYSLPYTDMMAVVHKFRGGFCDALMDLQSFHLIEIISDVMNTEQPSQVMDKLFIGEALSVRNVHTLQHPGITHIICFCLDEIGQ
ncbi:Dual specificity protein phosphatase PHS1 [Platanthera guangdongensis]|uniref:Dual specificity protein phosphatase PHS1 n=1 Tax=Platanthera guangdongensis TaxID=2320717 RepID=A0ABR2LXP3_9ASPA